MAVTTGRIVVSDNDVGTKQTNLQHHASQDFFFVPGGKRLFSRLRKTKIAKAKEVRFRALHFGSGQRLPRANNAEFFVKLGTDCVLPALAESGKKRDGVNAVLA